MRTISASWRQRGTDVATIIDTLVTRLTIDGTDFKKGRQQNTADLAAMRKDAQATADQIAKIRAASTADTKKQDAAQIASLRAVLDAKRRSIKDVQSAQKDELAATKKQAEAYGGVRDQLVGVLALFTAGAGLKSFVTSTVAGVTSTANLAKNIDVSTEALSTFEAVAKRTGKTADDANASISAIAQLRVAAQTNPGALPAAVLNYLGVTQPMLLDKDPKKLLDQLAKKSETTDPAIFAAYVGQLGLGGLVPALQLGRKGFDDLYDSSVKVGQINKADADAAKGLTDQYALLSTQIGTLGRQMITWAAGPATAALKGIADLTVSFPGLTKVALAFGTAWTALTGLKVVGVAGRALFGAKAAEAAEGAGIVGPAAAAVIPAAGPLAFLWELFHPTQANVGEDQAVAALRADEDARRATQGKPAAYQSDAGGQAFALIAGREGFSATAYKDSDGRYRVGYGSDTTTVGGVVSPVSASSTATRDTAKADLIRRINAEFLPKAQAAAGASWSKLTAAAQAALIDIAYNYGGFSKIPSVAAAAKTGDANALAAAIRKRSTDNKGVNANRRIVEAQAVLGGGGLINRAQLAAGSTVTFNGPVDNSTTINGPIQIATAATDAKGIAGSIGPAIRARGLAFQANSGLG